MSCWCSFLFGCIPQFSDHFDGEKHVGPLQANCWYSVGYPLALEVKLQKYEYDLATLDDLTRYNNMVRALLTQLALARDSPALVFCAFVLYVYNPSAAKYNGKIKKSARTHALGLQCGFRHIPRALARMMKAVCGGALRIEFADPNSSELQGGLGMR